MRPTELDILKKNIFKYLEINPNELNINGNEFLKEIIPRSIFTYF
jgi:hypothetical protein